MRKSPRQQRSQQMVESLVEAAGEVLATSGLEHFTTVHVAERAGVSVGSLYQYFANKEALVAAVMERMNRELGDTVNRAAPALLGAPPHVMIRGLLDAAFEFLGRRNGLHMELLRNWHRLDIQRSVHRFEQTMMDVMRTYALAHLADLKFDHAPVKSFIVINSVVFTLLRYLSLPQPAAFGRDALVEELTQMIAGYFTVSAPLASRTPHARPRKSPGRG